MSHPENEKLYEELRVFLEERNLALKDIMTDERGAYYITEPEEGEIDRDGKMTIFSESHKMYLPMQFQEIAQI